MPFTNIIARLLGDVPGLQQPNAKLQINEALQLIYDTQLWSFQMREGGWLTPGLLFPSGSSQSAGTITVTSYGTTLVGDAAASAQWAAYNTAGTQPPLTQLQIRVPYYSLYNIIGYDTTSNPPFSTLTLDRPWTEPPGAALSYMIYQAYFAAGWPASIPDFKRFFAIRDTTNAAPLDYWTYSQRDLALRDPQRTNFDQPSCVVAYQQDMRTGSPTYGGMLYELYPHPLSVLPYTYSFLRSGPLLVAPTDTLPFPLTENLVEWAAKEQAYLFKEASKGNGMQRGSGADWRFLSQAAHAKYLLQLKTVKDRDRDFCELYWTRFVRDAALGSNGEPFATITGELNVGRM